MKTILFMFLCTAVFAQHQTSDPTKTHAEMHAYESSNTLTINANTDDQYYGVESEMSVGNVSVGWSMVAGQSGTGDITEESGGSTIAFKDVAHGLTTGDYINVQSANHADTKAVTVISADSFTVAITHVGDETGYWQEGDYLLAGSGTAGLYVVNIAMTFAAGAASKNYKIEAVKNATHLDNTAFEITTQGTNHQSGSGVSIETIAEGDKIWLQLKNETDTQDAVYEHSSIVLHKL